MPARGRGVTVQRSFSQIAALRSEAQVRHGSPPGSPCLAGSAASGAPTTFACNEPSTTCQGKISHSVTGGVGSRPDSPTWATIRA